MPSGMSPLPFGGGLYWFKRAGEIDARGLLQKAEDALGKGKFCEARALAEEARRRLRGVHDPRVDRVLKGLRLLDWRRRAEKEFEGLGLTVDAIFWTPEEAVAVIGGVARHEGEVLDDQVLVQRIGKGEVVFLFKDVFKFRKRLDWSKD